jgi:hypothetical protein
MEVLSPSAKEREQEMRWVSISWANWPGFSWFQVDPCNRCGKKMFEMWSIAIDSDLFSSATIVLLRLEGKVIKWKRF